MRHFVVLLIAAVAIVVFPQFVFAKSPVVAAPLPTAATASIDCPPVTTESVQTHVQRQNVQIDVPVEVRTRTVHVPSPPQVIREYVHVAQPAKTLLVERPIYMQPLATVAVAPPAYETVYRRPGFIARRQAAKSAPPRVELRQLPPQPLPTSQLHYLSGTK